MPHHSRLHVIVIDVPGDDHDQVLAFWQGAIGQELTANETYPEYHGAGLLFCVVPAKAGSLDDDNAQRWD